jgi:creatinine amidohydrolase
MANLTEPKVHMGTISGGEGRALYATNPVVLLPMGSHEDQGPHAPMGDYLLAEKLAELIALSACARGTRTVVAPVLAFGGADHFGPMPGGIAISPATLTAVIADMVASLHRNGLTRIVFINGHGGNVGPIAEVAREVHRRTGMIMPSLYLWRIGYGLLPRLLGAEMAKKVAGHGADPVTSTAMHLFPELIRRDLIPAGLPLKRCAELDIPFTQLGAGSFDGAEVGLPHEYEDIYNLGVGTGDPTLCSEKTGAALVEQMVDVCARFVAHFAGRVPAK